MRGRLIIHDPDDPKMLQLPLAVLSDERGTWINGDDWILPLEDMPLSEVTPKTIRKAMHAPASSAFLLSDERELPDYIWQSIEMLDWLQQWREDTLSIRGSAARSPGDKRLCRD